jgi:lipoprotein-anchoring transpeptidase ErfK/SrfK
VLDAEYFALHVQLLPDAPLTRRCDVRVNRSFTMPHRGLRQLTNRCPFALFIVKRELNHKGAFMLRLLVVGVVTISLSGVASAQSRFATSEPAPDTRTTVLAAAQPELPPNPVTGFIEFLFGEPARQAQSGSRQWFGAPPQQDRDGQDGRVAYANAPPDDQALLEPQRSDEPIDPRFLRQEVAYNGAETPGTVVVDTSNHFLYLVGPGGRALRYGIGVARPGYSWSGRHAVSAKKEWPDWIPPQEMLKRQPYLPHFVAGGPHNPLGARALYLGSSIYRIHGSNEPWTIGKNVSSGCIRMRNADVIDLYERVKVGTKVVVM